MILRVLGAVAVTAIVAIPNRNSDILDSSVLRSKFK